MPTRRSARRHPVATIARLIRPSPELVIITATLISACNALVALDIVHLAGVQLAVLNIGLASVLGIVARGLFPATPHEALPAERRANPERGSTS